jgi:tetratricopeptide (TPR) repeat protein
MPKATSSAKSSGKIITFYSYKGGTGRSMTLANVAWILTGNGHRVLVVDWDLEAPGLHRYLLPFLRDPELAETRGLMDLLWEYTNLVVTPRKAWPSSIRTATDLADVRPYVAILENPFANAGGCLHLLCAGQQTPLYAAHFRDFNWKAFYEQQGGGVFIERLAKRLRGQYDFVLIDSRTGVADTSGICTVHLPDEVVLCFTYNRQSVKGVSAVAQSIHAQRTRPPRILPVPMRVEKGVEGLNEARDFCREELDRFLPTEWTADERTGHWDSCEVSYYPNYAFGETLAVFRDRPQVRNSLVADMRWLASRLAPADRELNLPLLDAEIRETILRRYRLRDPRKATLAELLAQSPSAGATAGLLRVVGEAKQTAEMDEEYSAALGQTLTRAVKLTGLGQPDAAQSLALAATELYRRLARNHPVEFLPALADSLNALGNTFGVLGQREEALVAVQEAVEVQRGLSADRPDPFRPNLASSLNNLSNLLSEVGRAEDAVAAARESADIYRHVAGEQSETFLPNLASSLNNLGTQLRNLNRQEDAVATVQEAIEVYRRLVGARPDAFLPNLAVSLNSVSNSLRELGRREEALTAAREATVVYRRLVDGGSDGFRPNLASSLNNFGNSLNEVGRREEALAALREATDVYRSLASARPDAFLSSLAASLDNLGSSLTEFGRSDEALEVTREAKDVYRRLVDDQPDAFLPNLASSLNKLGNSLNQLGRREDALPAMRGATDLYRRLTADRPDAFRVDLARSLDNLTLLLSVLGLREDARGAAREATGVYRLLAAVRPDIFLPDLATSLDTQGNCFTELGDYEDAVIAAQEAVGIRRQLSIERPDVYLPDLAIALDKLSNYLGKLERREEAVSAGLEAVALLAPIFLGNPAPHAPLMKVLYDHYVERSQHFGNKPDEKLRIVIEEALERLADSQRAV